MPATHHARAAPDAARPIGAFPSEERVGHRLVRLPRNTPDPGLRVGVAEALLLRVLLEQAVGLIFVFVVTPEHLLGLS